MPTLCFSWPPAVQYVQDEGTVLQLQRKLAPPLVTLLGAEPELQYVALRNIALIIQAQPGVLANDVKVFFVKVGASCSRACAPGRASPCPVCAAPSAPLSSRRCPASGMPARPRPALQYNDPSYVKMEKLGIMTKLVNERNIDQVLLEFKEYATEVDVDFVRKAVRAIGYCAVSIQSAAER